MGGQQATLSLTLVLGPPLAGVSFDWIGVSTPCVIGSLPANLSLAAALAFGKRNGEEETK